MSQRRQTVVTSASSTIYVSSSSATTHFSIASSTATPTHGTSFCLTVRPLAANGSLDQAYTGTVHLTSSDPLATLPTDYTFTTNDAILNGHTFGSNFLGFCFGGTGAPKMGTAGAQTVTVLDTSPNNTITPGVVNLTVR